MKKMFFYLFSFLGYLLSFLIIFFSFYPLKGTSKIDLSDILENCSNQSKQLDIVSDQFNVVNNDNFHKYFKDINPLLNLIGSELSFDILWCKLKLNSQQETIDKIKNYFNSNKFIELDINFNYNNPIINSIVIILRGITNSANFQNDLLIYISNVCNSSILNASVYVFIYNKGNNSNNDSNSILYLIKFNVKDLINKNFIQEKISNFIKTVHYIKKSINCK